jgi:Trypsin-co-occurring domain 1
MVNGTCANEERAVPIGTPGSLEGENAAVSADPGRRLVATQVGSATVYIEQIGPPAERDVDESLRQVSIPSPAEAFEKAGEALRECVRIVGERIEALTDKAKPAEISVEFTLSFEAEGRAHIIPILVTGRSSVTTGLAVRAVWHPGQ